MPNIFFPGDQEVDEFQQQLPQLVAEWDYDHPKFLRKQREKIIQSNE